jgi:hypothetical protein
LLQISHDSGRCSWSTRQRNLAPRRGAANTRRIRQRGVQWSRSNGMGVPVPLAG